MNIAETFEQMQSIFNPDAAAYLNKKIQWNISGENGGQWALHIHDQTCELIPGGVEEPDIVFQVSDANWLALSSGQLNNMQAFTTGKLKISGDMMLAMRMSTMFRAKRETTDSEGGMKQVR